MRPIYGCPEIFRDSPTTSMATFYEILNRRLFRLSVDVFVVITGVRSKLELRLCVGHGAQELHPYIGTRIKPLRPNAGLILHIISELVLLIPVLHFQSPLRQEFELSERFLLDSAESAVTVGDLQSWKNLGFTENVF